MKASQALKIKRSKIKMGVGGRTAPARCFWTWPFGHIWGRHPSKSSYDRKCVVCHKSSTRSSYDSDWRFDLESES